MPAPSPTTRQKGISVVIETRPDFAGYMSLDFPENRKAREEGELAGSDGRVATRLWNDLTDEATAKLVVLTPEGDAEPTLPEIGDTLAEAYADVPTGAAIRSWSVMEISRPRKAGNELLLEIKVKRSELVP